MKIRWTRRGARLRIDDLELDALRSGRVLREDLPLPGGRWTVELRAGGEAALEGEGGELRVVLGPDELVTLLDQAREGVEREGPPRLTVEKDFLPEHLAGA